MNDQKLIQFFKWCTIINVALFMLSAVMILLVPNFIYRVHGTMFHLSREAFDVILYAFLGLYKIFIIVFNLVPYMALHIVNKKNPAIP